MGRPNHKASWSFGDNDPLMFVKLDPKFYQLVMLEE